MKISIKNPLILYLKEDENKNLMKHIIENEKIK